MTDRKAPHFRRVVTGHDASGKAVVWIDGAATNHKYPDEKVSSTLMWSTAQSPAEFLGDTDEGARILGTAPPAFGSRFTMMEIMPGNVSHGLHRTDTIDYVICIAGEITMLLDDGGSVKLRAGDVLIQRGTNHGWVNEGSVPCRLAVVLLDGNPKRSGSVAGSSNAR